MNKTTSCILAAGLVVMPAVVVAQEVTSLLPIEIHVMTTPKAAAELTKKGESVSVGMRWMGEPTRGHEDPEMNIIVPDSAGPVILPSAGGVATFKPAAIRRDRLSWIKPGTWEGYVDVVSTRRTQQLNLIYCDGETSAPLRQMAGKTITLHCKLVHGE